LLNDNVDISSHNDAYVNVHNSQMIVYLLLYIHDIIITCLATCPLLENVGMENAEPITWLENTI